MLLDEHYGHLENLVTGGLMRLALSPDVEEALIKQGYARNAVGGLMATEAGHKLIMERKK